MNDTVLLWESDEKRESERERELNPSPSVFVCVGLPVSAPPSSLSPAAHHLWIIITPTVNSPIPHFHWANISLRLYIFNQAPLRANTGIPQTRLKRILWRSWMSSHKPLSVCLIQGHSFARWSQQTASVDDIQQWEIPDCQQTGSFQLRPQTSRWKRKGPTGDKERGFNTSVSLCCNLVSGLWSFPCKRLPNINAKRS